MTNHGYDKTNHGHDMTTHGHDKTVHRQPHKGRKHENYPLFIVFKINVPFWKSCILEKNIYVWFIFEYKKIFETNV